MSDYWKKRLEELNKNNVKKSITSGKSTSSNKSASSNKSTTSNNYWKQKLAELENDDIAPLTAEALVPKTTAEAPVVETKERSWFEKGKYLEDGHDAFDISKTILSSANDLGDQLQTGVIGMGEKVVDAVAWLGGKAVTGTLGLMESGRIALNNVTGRSDDNQKDKERYESAKNKVEEKVSDFIAKDLYDEEAVAKKLLLSPTDLLKYVPEVDGEEGSVFGDKADSLAQSAGQLVGQAALQSVGVPWFVTSGVTSFGGQVETALNEGANYNQAGGSAVISAAAEILTEKLSGGIKFGGKTLDDVLLKPFTKQISNKVLGKLANFGIDALGEGFEEVLSSAFSRLGTKLYKEEDISELLASEEALDEYLESFLGGFFLGGTSNIVTGGADGNDSDLTEQEQKVYDKVVEDRIAEETKDGKKLTKAEEKKIREEVRRALDRGYIDTETIESVLGGEEYGAYKRLSDARGKYEQAANDEIKALQEEHKKLQEEYDELNELALTEAKLGDQNRQADIKARQNEINAKISEVEAELKELEADTSVSDLKARFDENFVNVVKGSRLEESYRRKQIFEADFEKFKGTKHEDAARKSLENAVKAGADNSKGMRTLVESNARFSANTGVVFEYTTNEKEIQAFTKSQTEAIKEIEEIPEAQRTEEQNKLLAEMKGTLEKVQSGDMVVDGTKKTGVITVNLDSPKALNVITGHEIAHLLEKAKHYKKAQDALFKYASMKGVNIEEELDNRARKYGGIKDSDSKAELFADLVGGYLYTDYDFVVHLANTDQSVFHSMWDSVKYLYKMATAGSKEARQLERVKRNFEKAYKEFTKSGAKVEGEKYSITEPFVDKNGNRYENAVLLDTGAFDNVSPKNWWKVLKNHLENRVEESTFIMPVADESGNTQMLEFAKSNERVSKNGGKQHKVLGELYMTSDNISKLSAIHIDEIVEVSESDVPYHTEADGHGWLDANGWLHRTAYVINAKNGSIYQVTMDIAKTEDGRHILYALNGKTKKVGNAEVNSIVTKATKGSSQNSNFDDILPQNSEKSIGEANYSLTSEQEEYFKDSKVRDENGNLKVMYHGTSKGGFTSFDTYGSNYGLMGTGSYFTDNKSVAESYTNKGKGNNKQVYESYLNITNPLDMDAEGNAEEWAKAFPDVDFPDSGTNEDFYRAVEEFYSDQMMPKWEAAEEIRDSIQFGMGYDGITHIGGGRVNADGERHQVYIAFEPEQIKNIDNIAPTKDADIRYSLSEDTEGRKLSNEQQEYFKNVSPLLKDENGNIKRYYHGTSRGDRVGTYFNPERATSGPMAFFTDNPEIAEGYSKSKADTSMAYDPDYDSYETQFRVNINGHDMSLIDAWRYLPMDARARIKDRAEHTHYDWDDYETLIYDESTTEAGGGFSWQIREARGNILRALNEQWLNSGNLFNEEGKYIDVLKFIGVHDEFKKLGYGEPYYKDPYFRDEKVFEVYLNVTNPFHTADVDEEFLNDARDWVENTDLSIYESETADSDLWDKRSLDPYEWLDRLEDDINNGTTHAWTSIPDVITDFLKEYGGYDGIVDAGGKHTGYGHQVVIPFYSEQIKNIDNETPTTDVHIDLSLSKEGDTNFAPNDSWLVYGNRVTVPDDIAPMQETVSETEQVQGTVNEADYAPMTEEQANAMYEEEKDYINNFTDADMPPEIEAPFYSPDTASIDDKALKNISAIGRDILFLNPKERRVLEDVVQKYSTSDIQGEAGLFDAVKRLFGEKSYTERIEEVYEIKQALRGYKINVSPFIKRDIADYTHFMRRNFGKISFSKEGMPVDTAYMELSASYPNFFPSDIVNPTDQLLQMSEIANMEKDETLTVELDDELILEATEVIEEAVNSYREKQILKATEKDSKAILRDELSKDKKTANQRKVKQQEYKTQMEALIGDTSTWVDKKLGISYEVNTLRRNLRDIVRDSNGKRNTAKADAIYDELQGKYNHNEAELNRESNRIKHQFEEMKITKAEDTYIQMLGEFRHNPETTLTKEDVKEFYEKHKNHIDEAKVNKAIEEARKLYDSLLGRVNQVLYEQGMKEIPYRKGYFPHFTEDKQGFLGKLFNWKTQNNEIPTSIAGLTEMFEPNRSWQSFNKQRKTDVTDYSFLKGLDRYVQGSLDWVYHIEDIQKRRAFENHIRYTHSEEGIKAKIDAIFNNEEYDADEMQEQIDLVYKEAANPLNNFIQDFHTATNSLAGKKSTFDRVLEQKTNRKVYSVMTNLSNRVSGNMVAGSVSSALTNFIPITQSWVEVSPVNSLRGMRETIASTIRDDGTIDKSDFLTNRLNKSENLYQTNWDKIGKGVSILMDAIDSFTSQTVWRSKYIQNISEGMSENEAVKNADQFAANVMADRSRGNQPTIFDSKSPVSKIFTAFQLEVNNQYGYLFKDAPQDIANKSKARLVKGYATAFLGAYAYNALYSSLTGRNAAFDPIRIVQELMQDLGFGDDDEEEEIAPVDVALNFTENILQEVPFIGGLLGGGRIPISSALPYGGIMEAYEGTLQDMSEGNRKALTKEWLNPVYYLAMPMGGGQIRKTNQGLAMFSDEHPVAGSYTDSGSLRFPVEDTPLNRLQAGVFGQYANKNAQTYFDEGYAPLKEKQIQEYVDSEMPIEDYWKYREGLSGLSKIEEKADYVYGLDLPIDTKNLLINNLTDRKEPIDLTDYGNYDSFEEFDYAQQNPEKYAFLEAEGIGYLGYKALDEDTKESWSWAFKNQDKYRYFKENGVYPEDYSVYRIPMLDFADESNEAYSWAFENPEKATFSKAITDDVVAYREITSGLYEIRADKDSNGKTINGSAKKKKKEYIWNLDIDDGAKYILFKNEYNSVDDYNYEIIDYLNGRDDISYDEMNTILEQIGFTVDKDTGYISW